MQRFVPKHGWGPQSKRAAMAITFDNLGEAAEIEGGMWGDQPVGQHYTADFLPRLIDLLGDVPATYFMEASNVALYPEAIRHWHRAGKEVGLHGWRHETWSSCDPARRRRLLTQSMAALREIGVTPTGFRPPGGDFPADAWSELAQAGLSYCSALGEPGTVHVESGLVAIPFDWRCVDAYMLEDLFGALRLAHDDAEKPLSIQEWSAALARTLEAALLEGGQRTFVFHSMFLAHSRQKQDELTGLIRHAKEADVWIASAGEIARFVAMESSLSAPAVVSPSTPLQKE